MHELTTDNARAKYKPVPEAACKVNEDHPCTNTSDALRETSEIQTLIYTRTTYDIRSDPMQPMLSRPPSEQQSKGEENRPWDHRR